MRRCRRQSVSRNKHSKTPRAQRNPAHPLSSFPTAAPAVSPMRRACSVHSIHPGLSGGGKPSGRACTLPDASRTPRPRHGARSSRDCADRRLRRRAPTVRCPPAALPQLFMRAFRDRHAPQNIVVIPSLTLDRDELGSSRRRSYEERLLLLMLLRFPRANMVYVTSQPCRQRSSTTTCICCRGAALPCPAAAHLLSCDDARPRSH